MRNYSIAALSPEKICNLKLQIVANIYISSRLQPSEYFTLYEIDSPRKIQLPPFQFVLLSFLVPPKKMLSSIFSKSLIPFQFYQMTWHVKTTGSRCTFLS